MINRRVKQFEQGEDGDYYVHPEIASVICGVTIQSFRGWMTHERPPPSKNGMVPLRALGDWIRTEQVLKPGRGGSGYPYFPSIDRLMNAQKMPGIGKKEAPDVRLKRLQADKVQHELDVATGKVVPVEDVKHLWSTIVTRVKTKMTGLPVKMAPLITGLTDQHEVQQKLSDSVYEALEALADDDEV